MASAAPFPNNDGCDCPVDSTVSRLGALTLFYGVGKNGGMLNQDSRFVQAQRSRIGATRTKRNGSQE